MILNFGCIFLFHLDASQNFQDAVQVCFDALKISSIDLPVELQLNP